MSIEQIGTGPTVIGTFLSNKIGKVGLTVKVNLYKIVDDSDWDLLEEDEDATEIALGMYAYTIPSAHVTERALYVVVFLSTDSTVALKQIPTMWAVGSAWVENIDQSISNAVAEMVMETDAIKADTEALIVSSTQILGIAGQNVKWSSMSFDENQNMTSATITQYTDNTLITQIQAWLVTATYNDDSELLTYQLAVI